jgi:alkaline phosphatase D
LLSRIPEAWRDRLRASVAGYRAGLPFNFDSWDGYPPARERLYRLFRSAGSQPLVFSGDSHASWANDLYDEGGALVGAEFGTTAITSPSFGSLLPGLGGVLAKVNPEVAFCDQDGKGYTLVTLTPEGARADFVAVSTVTSRQFSRKVVASWVKSAKAGGALTEVA